MVRLRVQRELAELGTLVDQTARFFEEHRIDPDLRNTVDLALEELFVNLVRHNKGQYPIDVSWDVHGKGIKVTLIDRDVEAFDPTAAPDPDLTLSAKDRRPGGLGVYLTRKLVDSLSYDYHNRISTITFTKEPDV